MKKKEQINFETHDKQEKVNTFIENFISTIKDKTENKQDNIEIKKRKAR